MNLGDLLGGRMGSLMRRVVFGVLVLSLIAGLAWWRDRLTLQSHRSAIDQHGKTAPAKLYLPSDSGQILVEDIKEVLAGRDRGERMRNVFQELITVLGTSQVGRWSKGILSPQSKLLTLFLDKEGTLYLNLSQESVDIAASGIRSEWLTASAFTQTAVRNFSEIKQVVFLVEGGQANGLFNHLRGGEPFEPDENALHL